MADNVLQSFVIQLKYIVDDPSAKKFHDNIQQGIKGLNALRLSLIGAAVGVEELVRRTTGNMARLGALSKETDTASTSIERLRARFQGAHLSIEQADSQLRQFMETMRRPGQHSRAVGIIHGDFKDFDEFMVKASDRYAALLKQYGSEDNPFVVAYRNQLDAMQGGLSESIRALNNFHERQMRFAQEAAQIRERFGFGGGEEGLKRAEKAADDVDEAFTRIGKSIDYAFLKLLTQGKEGHTLLDSITKIANQFADWMGNEDTQRKFTHFLEDLSRLLPLIELALSHIEFIVGTLVVLFIGNKIAGFIITVERLIGSLGRLRAAFKTTEAEGAAASAAAGAKAGSGFMSGFLSFLKKGLVVYVVHDILDSIKGPIDNFFASLGGPDYLKKQAGIVIGEDKEKSERGFFGKLFNAPQTIMESIGLGFGPPEQAVDYIRRHPDLPGARDYLKRNNLEPIENGDGMERGGIIPHFQGGGIVQAALHAGEMVLPASISQGLQSLFQSGGGNSFGDITRRLLDNFTSWFSGDGSYRPLVELGDQTIDKLKDLLGIGGKPGGDGAPSTGGDGGGASGGDGGGAAGGGAPSTGDGVRTPRPGEPDQTPLEPGTKASIPKFGSGTGRQQAMDYFTSKGWTKEQAAGIVANLETESELKSTAKGDSGLAYGIGQWHPDRQANFRRVFGHDIKNSTYAEQLAFVDWELKNTEKGAGKHLQQAQSAAAAGAAVSRYYERPRDVQGNERLRGGRAAGILAGYTPGQTVTGTTEQMVTPPQGGPVTGQPPGGGSTSTDDMATATDRALGMIGQSIHSPFLRNFIKAGAHLDPAAAAWCAAFVNSTLKGMGVKGSGSNVATSFYSWGHQVSLDQMQKGDVGVTTYGGWKEGQTGAHAVFMTGLKRFNAALHRMEVQTVGREGNVVNTRWRAASDLMFRRSDQQVQVAQTQSKTNAQQAATNAQQVAKAQTPEEKAYEAYYNKQGEHKLPSLLDQAQRHLATAASTMMSNANKLHAQLTSSEKFKTAPLGTGGKAERTVAVNSDHKVNINVYGSDSHVVAKQVEQTQSRVAANHLRNMRAMVA